MKTFFPTTEFQDQMTKVQRVLGWLYVPMHIVVIPLLGGIFALMYQPLSDPVTLNVAYYGVSLAYVLIVLGTWLRRQFDTLLDEPVHCLLSMGMSYAMYWALALAVSALMLVRGDIENPNNSAIAEISGSGYGPMRAIGIFIAPIVEESLFRGVAFGCIRQKNHRITAYVFSIVLFSLYHVWQYALVEQDPSLMIYALQYVPIGAALAWLYERTACIWCCVFFHMILNFIAFQILPLLS